MDKGYSACIETLFTDLDFADRPRAARECGYAAVEFWNWHDKPLTALADAGLPVSLALIDSADEAARRAYRDMGMLTYNSAPLFAEMLEETLCALQTVGTRLIAVTPGQELTGLSRGAQQDNIVKCLVAARGILEKYDAVLAIEPLNALVNHKGCYLSLSSQAFDIVRAAGGGRIGVLYDVYHQQITEGNLIDTITGNIGAIKHVHVADVPGRHQPGTGEINYRSVIAALRGAGYAGYIGCEFVPTGDTAAASREILSI